MATTKTKGSPTGSTRCCTPRGSVAQSRSRLREYSGLFKALGDETRLEILSMLGERSNPLCACEIEVHFDLSQPTISHHLRLLREAGLVQGERRGTWIYYSLEPTALDRLVTFRSELEGRSATKRKP